MLDDIVACDVVIGRTRSVSGRRLLLHVQWSSSDVTRQLAAQVTFTLMRAIANLSNLFFPVKRFCL